MTKPASILPFAKGLFLGRVQLSQIMPFPRQDEEERETAEMIVESYSEFAKEQLDGARFDQEHAVPQSVREAMGEMGILGLSVPEQYGGAGLSYTTYCRIMEETNKYCGSCAVVLGGHQSIGIKALLLHGTEEQKQEWLPKLASGEWMAAFALTEPGAGSDAAALSTSAEPVADGSAYVLNGQKVWITNGGFASFITVFAKTEEGITCFVLTPAELGKGFTRGAEEHKLGLRGSSTTQLFFDGVAVPTRNILGLKGKGLRVALQVLNYGRASLAAGCAGSSKRILAEAAKHASERVQFGQALAEFEMIQDKLAEMTADTYATETIAYLTAGLADRGDPDFQVESALCKVFATEACWRTCNHAVQVAGGIAYVSEYPYERFLRDARINLIFEGTNEILRHFIAMSGFKEVTRILAACGEDQSAETYAALVDERLGAPERLKVPAELEPLAEQLSVQALAFGEAVRAAVLEHGPRLAEREFIQARFAEVAIDLFVGFACLSRFTCSLETRSEAELVDERDVVCKAVGDALSRVARQLAATEDNLDDVNTRVSRAVAVSEGWSFPLVP